MAEMAEMEGHRQVIDTYQGLKSIHTIKLSIQILINHIAHLLEEASHLLGDLDARNPFRLLSAGEILFPFILLRGAPFFLLLDASFFQLDSPFALLLLVVLRSLFVLLFVHFPFFIPLLSLLVSHLVSLLVPLLSLSLLVPVLSFLLLCPQLLLPLPLLGYLLLGLFGQKAEVCLGIVLDELVGGGDELADKDMLLDVL